MDTVPQTTVHSSLDQGFRLRSLRIDPPTGLVAGPGGREMLDRKVMDVFMLMARHPGRVISRDELMTRLWPDVVVTDDALTRCVCVLRKQLSQAAGDARYRDLIETLPKRGYRFRGEIESLHQQLAAAVRKSGDHRMVGVAIAVSTLFAVLAIFAMGAA
jgi:DNA-binding winged helix-turn-helix (wHTH) protein